MGHVPNPEDIFFRDPSVHRGEGGVRSAVRCSKKTEEEKRIVWGGKVPVKKKK